VHHVPPAAVTEPQQRLNKVQPATQARRDQLLAALREAGPDGLLTDQLAKAVTKPCSCTNGRARPPVPGCTQCHGSGHRGCSGCEALPWLYPLERAGLIMGERPLAHSGRQVRWRLTEHTATTYAEAAELDAYFDHLADLADGPTAPAPPAKPMPDPAPLVGEWQALALQRDEQLALAAGSMEAMDDLVVELTDQAGLRIKDVAALLGVPAYVVSNARARAHHRSIARRKATE
jgi:hypothetical protein